MPKGNVVLTKTRYRKLRDVLLQEFDESTRDRVIEIIKKITDFDEDSYSYNKENYKISYAKKKTLKQEEFMHAYMYKKRLENEIREMNDVLSKINMVEEIKVG